MVNVPSHGCLVPMVNVPSHAWPVTIVNEPSHGFWVTMVKYHELIRDKDDDKLRMNGIHGYKKVDGELPGSNVYVPCLCGYTEML